MMFNTPEARSNLYEKLMNFKLSAIQDKLTFAQRLAAENLWSDAFTRNVIIEYKHFLFLAATCSHPVTPSVEVDQAWHLHLLYSHSYWDDLCINVLKFPLHHTPTKGGGEEQIKFVKWYAKTLESYEEMFSRKPSSLIWPPIEKRFQLNPPIKKRNRIGCYSSWIIALIVILFAIYFGYEVDTNISIIIFYSLIIWAILDVVFVGNKCDKCCRQRAVEVLNETVSGDMKITQLKCKYCGDLTTNTTSNQSTNGNGSNGSNGGSGGCGGSGCGGCGGG